MNSVLTIRSELFRRPVRTAATAVLLAGLAVTGLPATSSYADPPGTVTFGARVFSVALSQGQLYYTSETGQVMRLMLRTVKRSGGTVTLGAEQPLTTTDRLSSQAISASSGRVVFDRRARSYVGGGIRAMGENAVLGREASGNRALVQDWNGPLLGQTSYADMYDAKTQKVRNKGTRSPDVQQPPPAWPQGPQDVDGNYFLRARPDGSITRRDWQIGREIVVRPAGSPIKAVAIHGPWVAWVTDAPCHYELCTAQTLTTRNLSTGYAASVSTRGTVDLDISGGDLAYDAVPGDWPTRELRTIRLGTTTVTPVAPLVDWSHGAGADMYGSEPRPFDVEDELLAWVGPDELGHVAALAPSIDPPHYLGNAIAPSSFSTRWAIAVPVSKALPVCTVTIYRGTTKVRILNCANTIGMVSLAWDGRTASGAALPTGKYTYRISGRDDDGYWLRHYDGTLTAVGGTITKTA